MTLCMAVGCLISGIAAGASSRTGGVIGAGFVGSALGVFGFFMLAKLAMMGHGAAASGGESGQLYTIAAIFAAGGGVVGAIGTAIGWATVGKRASA
jgi:hypothetical protein